MIYFLKQKKIFKKFHKYLTKQNKNYDYFRNELYFTLFYRKNIYLNAIASFIRDIFILIGFKKKIDESEFFFFTLPTQSGYKIFENIYFFKKKKLLKIPSKKNRHIVSKSLYFFPTFEFICSFFSTLKLINIKKKHGFLIFIYVLRLALIVNVWKFFFEKNSFKTIKIYLHNDFDIYNAALLFAIEYKLIRKKIIPICFQHGIPTDEFFPTKAPLYYVWSKKMKKLYEAQNNKSNISNIKTFSFIKKIKSPSKIKKKQIDQNLYYISQGHTKMYGWKTNTNLINIFNNISKIYPNTYCLLHPSENKINNPYNFKLKKNIFNYPHDFTNSDKTKVYICFCSTAMLEIMKNQNIILGINLKVNQSKITFKYFKPPLIINNLNEFPKLFKKLNSNSTYVTNIIRRQNEYLKKLMID